MATYIVYPGIGKPAPDQAETFLTGAELAALYGLEIGDYEIGADTTERGTAMDFEHIHLIPRPDGAYRNIKVELGDNGTDKHIDKMVNPEKWHRDNRDRENKGLHI